MSVGNLNLGPSGELIFYEDAAGNAQLQVRMIGETVWLTQLQMTALFGRDKSVISRHIRNAFEEGEVEESATVANFATVQTEGGREIERQVAHYNLEVIISVGYRVKSQAGVRFRRWATSILVEYAIKGFALDDARLKDPGSDYFDELLERIRDIRASEKVFYKKVCDIFAQSVDYDQHAALAMEFFQTVQNKLHYAAHGNTAAEIVYQRADAGKHEMGLTSHPKPNIRKADVTVAKNFLQEEELDVLRLLVTQFLDTAELQARRRKPMQMKDWIIQLDKLIQLNGDDVLVGKGTKTSKMAEKQAHGEYEKYKAGLKEVNAYDELTAVAEIAKKKAC